MNSLGFAAFDLDYYSSTVDAVTRSSLRGDAISCLFYFANWHFAAGAQSYFAQFSAPSPLRHFWSLAIEEQFYLIWPMVVLTMSRRALVFSTLGIAVSAPVLRAVMITHGVPPPTVYSLTPCRVDALALGGLAAVLVREPGLRPRVLRLAPALAALVPLIWLAWTRGLYWLDPAVDVVAFSPLAVLAGAVVVRCSLELPADRFAAASGSELLGLTGHVLVGIAVSVAAAFASFHLFERHFLALKRNFV